LNPQQGVSWEAVRAAVLQAAVALLSQRLPTHPVQVPAAVLRRIARIQSAESSI
jgi:hypothetical protein